MIDLWIATPPARGMFGIVAAVLSVIAYLPYMLDTLRGNTRPHRACWLIWSVLASISFFSLHYEGATSSLGFAAAQAGCTTLIFVLSIARGQGQFLIREDVIVLCLAAFGLVLWYITDSAVYALLISIAISLLGGVLTIHKTYWFPESETMSTWVISGVAACFAVLAVGAPDWVLLAYPMYLLVLNGAIIGAWVSGQMTRKQRRPQAFGIFRSGRAR